MATSRATLPVKRRVQQAVRHVGTMYGCDENDKLSVSCREVLKFVTEQASLDHIAVTAHLTFGQLYRVLMIDGVFTI